MNPNELARYTSAVSMLWEQGLKDDARKMEMDAQKKGLTVGSCYTEEILEQFITKDPDMIELKNTVRILANYDDPVLVVGETGTGKELISRALHGSRTGRFVAINCPALSPDLMESELFGHVKGAFTGALTDKIGKFQYAAGGTLFIDEVGDMPPAMQALLLRVLQEKMITRVGDNTDIPVSTRIVCATNRNLGEMVTQGVFRLDLLNRLNVFELYTKPLSQRPGDIAEILRAWDKTGKFKPDTSIVYTGNVRQLWAMYRRWAVLRK